MDPVCLGISERSLPCGGIAAVVLAIVLSTNVGLPDPLPPVFSGQAWAASPNSNGNGKSGQKGNGGKSAEAGSGSGKASSGGGPASAKGIGGGLLRLLSAGSARLPLVGRSSRTGVATGPPMQLLPPQASSKPASPGPVGPPDPRPAAPAQLLLSQAAGVTADTTPAVPADPNSLEFYLQAVSDAQPAEAENQKTDPTYETNLLAAVSAIEANSSFDATVDAYRALAAIIAAFQEAENQVEAESQPGQE